ncbi:A/G-specific adenine glycosylase [Henriciella aquimarina]|uniref:A/G-specific adenine glycosylase n=1 Tax=Henriciella aquimarina TaxID=545261 RepID=UPI0009FCE077|nr:A/G-specific adenine glycosylase [Henriciella aquimarina]
MRSRGKAANAVSPEFEDLPAALLDWYARHARDLPWRVGPKARAAGATPDPYRVWLAEIMLQQTTVPHAARYFHAFTERWPAVDDLAAAEDGDVMAAWAGLGYYARARNLLKCAREVAAAGAWPKTEKGLRELPGIGAYTAGAVAALAFGERAPAVDGNVDRVFARLLAAKGEWKEEKARIAAIVRDLVPGDRPGEFAEALMDLGATICTPKRPNCLICPVRPWCAAHAEGEPERYPVKPAKKAKPKRKGEVFAVFRGDDVLVERRPDKGLLGGMLALPTTEWKEAGDVSRPVWAEEAGETLGEVRHVFTHFELRLDVIRFSLEAAPDGYDWMEAGTAADAFPSVFAKALKLAV